MADDKTSDAIRLIGIAKPTKRGAASHALLVSMLPEGVRTIVRYSPVKNGTMEEFEGALPFYEQMTAGLAAEGAQLIHLEGTPPFLILGHDAERRTLHAWIDCNVPYLDDFRKFAVDPEIRKSVGK